MSGATEGHDPEVLGAWFLCMMVKIPGSGISTTNNRQGTCADGPFRRLLPSFLRAKDELQEFQKSKSKKALPKPGCLFSLGS